jgi:hypothetical protein
MYMRHVTQSINNMYNDEQPYRLNKIVSLSSLLKSIHTSLIRPYTKPYPAYYDLSAVVLKRPMHKLTTSLR